MLMVSDTHAIETAALPRHHDDPFDRMLIAQAQIEDLLFVTHDRAVKPYAVSVLWL
jgi:PIN domain nuclease of toxin-antitoxin system